MRSSKKIRRVKVNRSYDGIDREEKTAGLMALRIFIVLVMIVFIVGTAALFAYNFGKAAENPPPSTIDNDSDSDGAYYQIYDTDVSDELIAYTSEFFPVSEGVEPKLYDYNDVKVNALMKGSIDRLTEAAARDGIRLEIVRAYMTHTECDTQFKSLCLEFEEEGDTAALAQSRAEKIFPPAKENEYRTGMLIKVSSLDSDSFEATKAYTWLYKNGVNYGFINRYTADKEDITGIDADLTVYRFVGTENARKMRSFGMCLEEYYDYCKAR